MASIHSSSTQPKTDWLQAAGKWLSQALFNTDTAADYFDVLAESVDPLWSLSETRAKVIEVIQEAPGVVTLVLKPVARWTGFEAGQFVQLGIEINGSRMTRTFSLSSAPCLWKSQGIVSVTLKRIPEGKVTGWIHENIRTGQVVSLSSAQGEFTPPANAKSIGYLAAGSGITPIMSHLREYVASIESGATEQTSMVPVTLVFYANREEDFIFSRDLSLFARQYDWFTLHLIATEEQGQISLSQLQKLLIDTPEQVYVCGPGCFRESAISLLQKVCPNATIHQEAFSLSPIAMGSSEDAQEHQMYLTKSNRQVVVSSQMNLLDQAEAAGLSPVSGCRMGICYTCKCQKKSGRVKNVLTGEISDAGEETIQLCVSVPVSDVELGL